MGSSINQLSIWRGKLSACLFLLLVLLQNSVINGKKPNIVFFLTDDQDYTMDSMQALPKVQALVGDKGATLVNAFVASPLCCPSRSSTLTGLYVHNHGAWNNSIEMGCNSIEWQNGPAQTTFATYLHDIGYNTFYGGKYLNDYGAESAGGLSYIPPGWDTWVALKGNAVYYNYSLSVDGKEEIHGDDPETDYLTTVIKEYSLNFINQLTGEQPFLMMIGPPACHEPTIPEAKYATRFSSLQAPRTPNFNIANGLDKNWFLRLGEQPLSDTVIAKLDEMYRNRLRTLLSVDDMVEEVINSLEEKNLLNDTYIIFSSDNGFHLGQFSLTYDKREPYEFDIRVPFMVRGPGIAEGVIKTELTTCIDIAPTILELAGVRIPKLMDGISMQNILMYSNTELIEVPQERSILVEHFGDGSTETHVGCEYLGTGFNFCYPEYDCKCCDSFNNTYSCVRRLGIKRNEVFCKWKDDAFEEYYDVMEDPYELSNVVFNLTNEYANGLANLLQTLTTCSGKTCYIP